jgi:hypothetical protein
VSNRSDSCASNSETPVRFPKKQFLASFAQDVNLVIHHPSRTSSTQTGSGQNPLRVKSSISLYFRAEGETFDVQVSSDTHIQPTTTLQAGKERPSVTQFNASCFYDEFA